MPNYDRNYGSSTLKQAYPLGQEPPSVLREWQLEDAQWARESRPAAHLHLTDLLLAFAGVSLFAKAVRKKGFFPRLLLSVFLVKYLHKHGFAPRTFGSAH